MGCFLFLAESVAPMIVLGMRSASMLPGFLFETESSSDTLIDFHRGASLSTDFAIKDWCNSLSSFLFFVRHEETGRRFIVKMLRSYKDTRYSLETRIKRQQCLLEGLWRNRVFTPELYIGLAPLYGFDQQEGTIRIGEIMVNPKKSSLDEHTEYVLVMQPQDQDTRLDRLLASGETANLLPLTDYVADIHNRRVFPVPDSKRWGSYDHLIDKLWHNLELLDFLVGRCHESDWADRKELADRASELKQSFAQVVSRDRYGEYFRGRVDEGWIRFCHGDIKSPHVWIEPDAEDSKDKASINILDAVDFNPMYNHIDVLSDFAMLAADVQARTNDIELVNVMIKRYLSKTYQDYKAARAVLDYYIIEKAIVGTGISILYDGLPDLGRAFLEVAETRLEWLWAR